MIACPSCGWFADVDRRAVEDAVWAEHVRDGVCADVLPVRGKRRDRTMCIKGHLVQDVFGICWECAALRESTVGQRARSHNRARPLRVR